jgi:hypothetical protein
LAVDAFPQASATLLQFGRDRYNSGDKTKSNALRRTQTCRGCSFSSLNVHNLFPAGEYQITANDGFVRLSARYPITTSEFRTDLNGSL